MGQIIKSVCAMHPAIIGTVRSLWTWLWGRYHVPQSVFLVIYSIISYLMLLIGPLLLTKFILLVSFEHSVSFGAVRANVSVTDIASRVQVGVNKTKLRKHHRLQ